MFFALSLHRELYRFRVAWDSNINSSAIVVRLYTLHTVPGGQPQRLVGARKVSGESGQ